MDVREGGARSDKTQLGDLPQWNLDDLYAGIGSGELKADFDFCSRESRQFAERFRGKLQQILTQKASALGRAIAEYEAIEERMGRILSYAQLAHATDMNDPANAKFLGDAQERITAASSHLLFFTLELNRLDNGALEAGMADAPELAHYRPWLDDLRKEKPHQLEDRIEQLFHEKSVTGRAAWNRLFDETISGLRFKADDEELGVESALNLLMDPDREKREAAAVEIGAVLKRNGRLFTHVTNTLAKDKEISDRWRSFGDVAQSRHLDNRVETEVVDALASAVRDAYPRISHRYFALKARWLGLGRMRHFDRNAPLPQTPQKLFSWNEARDAVLDAYRGFSPKMAEIAGGFFAKGWIDAPVRTGKAPGAFAHPTVPAVHPYVLLNYKGNPRDVMTLAHELGHGVHQVLAAGQGALMASTPLTLAETASVFGEMLTFRSLLDAISEPEQRKAMLARKVEDMINTVVRQIAFYWFERQVHEARREGELTESQLGDIWMEIQGECLGPAFELDDHYRSYWSYIPHFIHSPFYVYAYAFGDCLVNSLYAVYLQDGARFEDRYLAMLRAGGTLHHSDLLAPFGLDARQPDFWNGGLRVIEGFIDELESLG